MILLRSRHFGSVAVGAAAVLAIAATVRSGRRAGHARLRGRLCQGHHPRQAGGRPSAGRMWPSSRSTAIRASRSRPASSIRTSRGAAIYVVWHDEKLRRRPATIRVDFKSGWHAVRGLHVGTELAEVEKLNGKAFKMTGFDWELGGRVSNWQGGALAKMSRRLRVPPRLQPMGRCARQRPRQGERRKGISLQRPQHAVVQADGVGNHHVLSAVGPGHGVCT